ncbi:MAG: antibiotic biosynthesis monooxygenase [Gammaproteobacteria bacterium]|nr:antibiotic biosynthesis monooxygenase [Gammaproteobacteria bacterium]MDH5228129.1 antibiotic biosynthesis monooxygenase [Gammaproteobacteria bacterium]
MPCFIATLKIKPGHEADFERLQAELSQLTHAHEPDTFVYDIIRSRDNANTYVVYARFKDEAAFQLHQGTDFHERLVPPILATVDGEMDLKFYDFIA